MATLAWIDKIVIADALDTLDEYWNQLDEEDKEKVRKRLAELGKETNEEE